MRVYLAGPPQADDYRRTAQALVREAGWEPVDPFRRDFRGRTVGHEAEIVEGDLEDIRSCDAVLADFSVADEGTAMEAWYAHGLGKRVVVYTGGTEPHPWTVYVAEAVFNELAAAVRALAGSAETNERRQQ
jgi:nucleoside 2-deoxyribosyltransferase